LAELFVLRFNLEPFAEGITGEFFVLELLGQLESLRVEQDEEAFAVAGGPIFGEG
jgi:hypothetical protein